MAKIKKLVISVALVILTAPVLVSAALFNGPPAPVGMGTSGSTSGGWNIGNVSSFGLPSGSIYGIISNILMWLLAIFGFFGVIGFVISGIMYLTAAGNEGQLEKAKENMKYSAMGVAVGLIGVVVIQAIDAALNAYSLI